MPSRRERASGAQRLTFLLELQHFLVRMSQVEQTSEVSLLQSVFIASSSKSLVWARELQEALSGRMPSVRFAVWDQDIFQPTSNAITDLLKLVKKSSAGIFIFSPDDDIEIDGVQKTITRDNVVFEYGLFVGHLGLERTLLITPALQKNYRLLSDVSGLTTIRFSFDAVEEYDRQALLGPIVNKIEKKIKQTLSENIPVNLSTVESIGIQSATTETADSALSYSDSIRRASSNFALLGVGADKLTSNEPDFEKLVRRVMDRGGEIRLLLLAPDSYVALNDDGEERVANISQSVSRSLQRIIELTNKLKCGQNIKIRSYFAISHDHVPPFRLTFLDDEQCIVSPRDLGDADGAKTQPQIAFSKSTKFGSSAYYGAFRRYFEGLWRHANPETPQSMINRIESLNRRSSLIGCVHGRFQPPHKGHLEYILEAKARCEFLYIGITQPDNNNLAYCVSTSHRSDPVNNPLTFGERSECIRRMLFEQGLYERKHFIVIPFDIDEILFLKRYIPQTWMQYTTLIDPWNIDKNLNLENAGYITQVLTDKRLDEKITGTNIRALIRSGNEEYRNMISSGVSNFLDEIKFRDRISRPDLAK